MRTFEITIPPDRGEDVTMILQVQASSWLDAMRAGLDLLREETGLNLEEPGHERQLVGVRVRDVDSGAIYGVGSYGQLSSQAAGGPEEEAPAKRRPRRDTAPMGVMPPRDPERASSPTAREARAIVRSAGMRRAEEPRAVRGMPTIPSAEAIGGTGPTRLDTDAIPAELAKIGKPIVRSRALKRRIRSPSTQPMGALKPPDQQTFRPVGRLDEDDDGPSPVETLRRAVQMAFDHIPCRAAQILLRDADHVIRVEAARGDRSESLIGAIAQLPRKLEALWLDGLPYILGDLGVPVTYRKDGDETRSVIGSALWVPLVVEHTPVGVLLVLDSRHAKGFTPGELKGATYLASTVAEQLARSVG